MGRAFSSWGAVFWLGLPSFALYSVALWLGLRDLKRKIREEFKDDPDPPWSIWDERVQKQILGRDRGILYRLLVGPEEERPERPERSK